MSIKKKIYIPVENSETEGEHPIRKVQALILNRNKYILNQLYSFLTLGIWSLALYWSPMLSYQLMYDSSSLHKATHVYLFFKNGQK